jgi:hypothetical protein
MKLNIVGFRGQDVPATGPRLAVAVSRARRLRQPTQTKPASANTIAASGHITGEFHSACLAARRAGSIR